MNVLFISLGCDKNLVDSEVMIGLLADKGYQMTDDETQADVIVINTCCFIHDAKEESIQTILEMAEYKKTGTLKALIVTGCLAQRYQEEILEEIPEVDEVLGTTSYDKIVDAIQEALEGKSGVRIDPNTVFDVQAKRLHEYKRQLLNVMNIISLYNELLENPDANIQPQTFIFGAKAASGYLMAKQIIKLIWFLAEDIKKHPKINEKLNVVYMEDYNVTMSESLMPASEVSEQISLAGKEASGTGNMKFMINGAITIGTLDGANVEMSEVVGDENIFIFGLHADEVEEMWAKGYNASQYYNRDPKLRKITESLVKGYNGESFADIANYLLTGTPVADPYMCMADFESYYITQKRVKDLYAEDKMRWAKISLNNIAGAGIFSADRSIKEYAENIWNLKPLKV